MITIEELTRDYRTTIIKIMLKALLMIKIPITKQGLIAFLKGDKSNDTQKEPEFFSYSLYSIFSNFTVRQLEMIFNLLVENEFLSLNDSVVEVTPRGKMLLNRKLKLDINFLYLL